MRLVQLAAVAAFALLSLKLMVLAANGAFDEFTISKAHAQNAQSEQNQAQAPADGNAPSTENNPIDQAASEIATPQRQTGSSASSRDRILARLGERRDDLDKREEDLELRENLLQAAEKRLKAQLAKLEADKNGEGGNAGDASENAKDLVIIYESMKPKDAARIFDALSIDILHNIATSMNPRKISAVLAEMDVKSAERLTVEIATRAALSNAGKNKRKLSKIGG